MHLSREMRRFEVEDLLSRRGDRNRSFNEFRMRIVRKSNDMLTATSLIAAFLMLAGLGTVFVNADDGGAKLFAALLALIVVSGCVALTYRLLVPREYELTINSETIKFGLVGRTSSRRSISRSSMRCIIFDTKEGSLCVNYGGWMATPLAPEILIYQSQMRLVAEYIEEHWPEIPVVGQYEFQGMCRANTDGTKEPERCTRVGGDAGPDATFNTPTA